MFYSQNPESRYLMSKLLVFGPSSFPLLTTKSGAVVMAGGYYGAGRVGLLPHQLHRLAREEDLPPPGGVADLQGQVEGRPGELEGG